MRKQTKAQIIAGLDDFTRHYIIAALWSSSDESTPSGGEPMDRNYSIEDLTVDCLNRMIMDCKGFQEGSERALTLSGQSDEQNGHDFWLTRNGHGAGFWDRGLRLRLGAILTRDAKAYGSADLYVHGGKVHHY